MNLILVDQKFEKLEGLIENIDGNIDNLVINTMTTHKHVVHTVYCVVVFLNCEVCKQGMFSSLLPREAVLRCILDWDKYCCSAGVSLEFVKYVKVHKDPNITNRV